MEFMTTDIAGVIFFKRPVYSDERGMFSETWRDQDYRDAGIKENFVQDNISSSSKNVLRGLHYQISQPQGHLITIISGKIFDVGVDLRNKSPTFGQWTGLELVAKNNMYNQAYFPPGIAHGFCTLSDTTTIHYKCTNVYNADDEGGVLWDDQTINISWPIKNPTLTKRDMELPVLGSIPETQLPHIHY